LTGSTPFGLIIIIVTHILDTDLADRFYNYDHKRQSESHVSNVSVQEALLYIYIYIKNLLYFLCILFMWYFSLYICLFCYLSFPLCHHHRYLSISQSQPLRHNLFSPFTVHLSALFIDITFSLCCWRKLYSFLFSLLIHNSYVWSIKKLVIFCAESQVFLSLLNRIRLDNSWVYVLCLFVIFNVRLSLVLLCIFLSLQRKSGSLICLNELIHVLAGQFA